MAVETDPPVEQLYVHEGYYLTQSVQVAAAAAAANTYKNMAMCIKATYLTPLVCSREIPGLWFSVGATSKGSRCCWRSRI